MDIQIILCALLFASLGSMLGICSGMVPGLHVNTLSLILVSAFPVLEPSVAGLCASFSLDSLSAPLFLSCSIVSAAVTHSFLDFLPSLFLGVPEEGTVISVLPGHRLLLEGRAMDAVRCASLGSLVGALSGILLVLPLQTLMAPPISADVIIAPFAPWMLVLVSVALVLSELRKTPAVAVLDCRNGRIDPAPDSISIVPARPMEGEAAEMTGVVCMIGLRKAQGLTTPRGTFRFKSSVRPEGRVRLRGTWMIRRRYMAFFARSASLFLLSGALGLVCMEARPPGGSIFVGLGQSLLFPLLTGLFGFPSLLLSVRSGPIPLQIVEEKEELPSAGAGVVGAFAGFIAGWLPGITSTAATVVTAPLANRNEGRDAENARRFLVSVSAVGTSATVFSILAFVILGKVRSGSMAAVGQILGGTSHFDGSMLALFLLSVLVGSAVGYVGMLWISSRIVQRLGGLRLSRLNGILLVALVIMVVAFTGVPGLLLLIAATFVGLIPPRIGVGRVQLTGCLLLPITLALLGMTDGVTSALSSLPLRVP